MSGSGGVSIARTSIRGENRFYNPPPMRRMQQEAQLIREKQRREDEEEVEILVAMPPPRFRKGSRKNRVVSGSEISVGSSNSSGSGRVQNDGSSNLDRFLEHTTPVVQARLLPLRSKTESYYIMSDLWESFAEWSAYGVGVPLPMHVGDSTVQYYVPYLSGIQLYAQQPPRNEDNEGSSSNGTSNDVDLSVTELSLSGETEISNTPPQGRLLCEYLEYIRPHDREPLANKISDLAMKFPELMTYRSCDLSPSSWFSVSWYPIYRIPVGPSLQNLEACFLTFHSLSTTPPPSGSMGFSDTEPSIKLPLPTFGLASYKLKLSVWNQTRLEESQKIASLLQAADKWMKRLQVHHPDYTFFTTNTLHMR